MWGDVAYYISTVWKTGGMRPPCPPPNCAHGGSHCDGAFCIYTLLMYTDTCSVEAELRVCSKAPTAEVGLLNLRACGLNLHARGLNLRACGLRRGSCLILELLVDVCIW